MKRNIERIRTAMEADRVLFMDQAHRDDIAVIEDGRIPGEPPRADALMTNRPGVALMVKQADCQAVLLYDPVHRAVANIHCGWRGNVRRIAAKTIWAMSVRFGSRAADLVAAVSPSLGPCCGEFKGHDRLFPAWFSEYRVGKDHFDLWALTRRQLMEAGLSGDRIHVSVLCTRCRPELFFSHRGEGLTGRSCTVVMLAR